MTINVQNTEGDQRRQEILRAGIERIDPDAASIRYLTGRQSLGGSGACYLDAREAAGDGPGYTWSIENTNARAVMEQIVGQPDRSRRFDYVFVGSALGYPDGYCRVRTARLAFDQPAGGIWASDHFGLVVDLELGRR